MGHVLEHVQLFAVKHALLNPHEAPLAEEAVEFVETRVVFTRSQFRYLLDEGLFVAGHRDAVGAQDFPQMLGRPGSRWGGGPRCRR